jgi:hypothetical protein
MKALAQNKSTRDEIASAADVQKKVADDKKLELKQKISDRILVYSELRASANADIQFIATLREDLINVRDGCVIHASLIVYM